MKIGILHPGEMGASVGAAARAAGNAVVWASAGRSDASRHRAEEAGLEDAGTVEELIAGSEVIVSVCPPESARALAASVMDTGFTGIYVDANAVSTETARGIAGDVEAAGARFVDGGIIGPPAHREGTTRLYLSGAEAATVASTFRGGLLETLVVGDRPGSASALKMCYAAWTKGSAALLTAIRALAVAEGVESALLEEWNISQHGLEAKSAAGARNNAFKAWRFAGEMREIAETFAASGLPGGFHEGAADIYGRLAAYKDCDPPPELAEIIEKLLDPGA
jgi:3-hydroxyisobutyrate dehydrogenase-like beta-hydroxyacid dehydrogenase